MPQTEIDPTELLPLTPVAFDILLALLEGEAHGYAIMQSVQERTGGASNLHAGTLYRALSRLVAADLIEELDELPADASDERRDVGAGTPGGSWGHILVFERHDR